MEKSRQRTEILSKITDLEAKGLFDIDVEPDPPTIPLKPGQIDYTYSKFKTKIKSEFANLIAKTYFDHQIKIGNLIIKEVIGLENYLSVEHLGVMITANHFNPFDNYAVFKAIEKNLGRKRLYKIIREGNYTSFKGLYGFFFRNCNTLPIGSDIAVFKEFSKGIQTLINRKEKILIYPEQAMWWNYKKPRPLKPGAFRFAAKFDAPVLPIFITMEDSEKIGADGFPVQAYTINILPPIFPKVELSVKENAKIMCEKNYKCWCECYEKFYGTPLTYNTKEGN